MRCLTVLVALVFAVVVGTALSQQDEANAAFYDLSSAPMAKRVHGLSLLRKGKLFRQQAQKRQFGNEYLWNYLQPDSDY
ncbi:hypothetical protein QR680_002582 [Steinernema hermaphroditum]|uniref:Uncharacterized protein n=1 Tax=Steinernema hermaphroditum TaxID=289476 RepID=A0AA39H380_9BILA|nr:hypothetical protein QR680_002582 [Steinernema hermaphroditum]